MERRFNFEIVVDEGRYAYCGLNCSHPNESYSRCDLFGVELVYAGTEDDDVTKKFVRCHSCKSLLTGTSGYESFRSDLSG